MNKNLIYSLFLIFIFLLTACSGGSDKSEPVPAPIITSFTASKTDILAGEAVNLTAVFANGQGVIDTGVGSINSGESKVVLPNNTTIYTLTVKNSEGVEVNSTITIETVPLIITSITNPVDGITVHDDTSIRVSIDSQLEISKVVAEVDERSTFLNFYNDTFYTGLISLTGLADGEYTLKITGTDSLGRSNSRQKQITIDNLPVITISEPKENAFASPLLPLDISCADESGDCQITVKNNEILLASSMNQLNETIDLSDFIGEKVSLFIEGKSNSEQTVSTSRDVYVNESDVEFILIKEFSSEIVDFDGERTLIYGDVDDLGKQVQVANINNDDIIVLDTPTDHPLDYESSFLTPTGAIYQTKWGTPLDWNNNELFTLEGASIVSSAEDYVLLDSDNNLIIRTLSTKSSELVNSSLQSAVISANGTVVGENNWSLIQYKNQEATRIDLQPGSAGTSEGPLIDDSFILYHETDANINVRRIVLHDGNDLVFAVNPSYHWGVGNRFYISRGKHYAINKGWLAYLDGIGSSANQLWTRDLQGKLLQRTNFEPVDFDDNFGYENFIETLADNGELMLVHDNKRYLSKTNGDLILVGSSDLGVSYFRNGTWYIVIEESLFELTTN